MFHVVRQLARTRRIPHLLSNDLPSFVAAWLVAETCYKWGSVTIETLGFLATWWAFGAVCWFLFERRAERRTQPQPAG